MIRSSANRRLGLINTSHVFTHLLPLHLLFLHLLLHSYLHILPLPIPTQEDQVWTGGCAARMVSTHDIFSSRVVLFAGWTHARHLFTAKSIAVH